MTEIWKDIKGYENLYQISSLGRVKSLGRWIYSQDNAPYWHKERIKKDGTSTGGYRMVTLSKEGKNSIYRVHRLVAQAFIPNPYNKETVNHKDECVTNNCVDNLEWMTQKENNDYGTRKERQRNHKNVKGHRKNFTKENLVKEIISGLTYQ